MEDARRASNQSKELVVRHNLSNHVITLCNWTLKTNSLQSQIYNN